MCSLAGNDLPARARSGFFPLRNWASGPGLNLVATVAALPGIPIRYTSFEAFPMTAPDMARALAAFPELDARGLLDAWTNGARAFTFGRGTGQGHHR